MTTEKTEYRPVGPMRLRTSFFMEYPLGLFNGEFARQMRDNGRLMGMVCRNCGFTMLPPQPVCTVCHAENFSDPRWEEMGPQATVAGFMSFNMPFINPTDLSVQSSAFPVGILMVDSPGLTTGFLWHYIGETDLSKVYNGMRVRAVFRPKEERQGLMTDILYWLPVKAGTEQGD
jgi:uncharacterized OB-fold protein